MYSQLKFLSIWDNALLKFVNRVRKVTDNPGENPIYRCKAKTESKGEEYEQSRKDRVIKQGCRNAQS